MPSSLVVLRRQVHVGIPPLVDSVHLRIGWIVGVVFLEITLRRGLQVIDRDSLPIGAENDVQRQTLLERHLPLSSPHFVYHREC